MKLRALLATFLMVSLMLIGANAMALELGTDITIWDTMGSGSDWHGVQEDQEVEPGCSIGQQWDLEGMYLNGTTLTIVGGYDFVNGQGGYAAGDIFIDVDGDALYGSAITGSGSGNTVINNIFGYDYVLDLDLANLSYDVISINSGSTVTVYYGQNDESNPWLYNDGGSSVIDDATIAYFSGLGDSDVGGLLGGSHNAVQVDLGFLGADLNNALLHTTYQCGNDNLIGKSIPDATTLALLGTAMIIGALFIRRRRFEL